MGLLVILLQSGHGCGEAGLKHYNQTQVEALEEQAAAIHGIHGESRGSWALNGVWLLGTLSTVVLENNVLTLFCSAQSCRAYYTFNSPDRISLGSYDSGGRASGLQGQRFSPRSTSVWPGALRQDIPQLWKIHQLVYFSIPVSADKDADQHDLNMFLHIIITWAAPVFIYYHNCWHECNFDHFYSKHGANWKSDLKRNLPPSPLSPPSFCLPRLLFHARSVVVWNVKQTELRCLLWDRLNSQTPAAFEVQKQIFLQEQSLLELL